MEFRLDAAPVELQQTVTRFCADRFRLDEVARGHALHRHQFGVPIGSFQAVKPPDHLLKRAWVLENCFGVSDAHALHLGSMLVAPS